MKNDYAPMLPPPPTDKVAAETARRGPNQSTSVLDVLRASTQQNREANARVAGEQLDADFAAHSAQQAQGKGAPRTGPQVRLAK